MLDLKEISALKTGTDRLDVIYISRIMKEPCLISWVLYVHR